MDKDKLCSSCDKPAVYSNQGTRYCKEHFLSYFESKVFKTIFKYKLIEKGDKVCVAASGGKDSTSALYLVAKYCRKYKIDFFALSVDEGIAGYRDEAVDSVRQFSKSHKIKLHVFSFKERFDSTMDQLREVAMAKHKKKPCSVCGVLRRTILNQESRRLGATKLVTGHNLDDEAQTFLMNVFQGNMSHNAKMGPIAGIVKSDKFIPRIKPLYFISEQETKLYSQLKEFNVGYCPCPHSDQSFRRVVKQKLNEIQLALPNAKYGVVNSFLEILPDLKAKYRGSVKLNPCKLCGEPTTMEVCNACTIEEKICKELKFNKDNS